LQIFNRTIPLFAGHICMIAPMIAPTTAPNRRAYESISNWGLCGILLNLRLLFSLHSRIPTNEGLPELVVKYFRPHLE
jgi:hypothetical protein